MQVAHLIQNDRAIYQTWTINLVKLLNRKVFVQIEAEHGIKLLTILSKPTDQKNFGSGDLNRGKATDRRWNLQVHFRDLFLGDFKFFKTL